VSPIKRKVAILCPSYDGKVVCDFAVTMAVIFQRAAVERPDLELNLNFWMNEALLQKARSNLFGEAYDAGVDDIVFIDSDQSFDAQAFFDLIDHPVDVVGVPVPMKVDEERYNLRPEDPWKHSWNPYVNLLEVECIGTGFLRLSRAAMTAVWEQSTPYFEDKPRRLICDLQIIDGGLISEDVQLCKKLTDAGFKIFVDVAYTCDHFGVKKYEGDYEEFLRKKMEDELHNQTLAIGQQTTSASITTL
jgi:hypothetical protein